MLTVFYFLFQEYREKNRGGKLFNHLSGISESIPALGWVTVVSRSNFPFNIGPWGLSLFGVMSNAEKIRNAKTKS